MPPKKLKDQSTSGIHKYFSKNYTSNPAKKQKLLESLTGRAEKVTTKKSSDAAAEIEAVKKVLESYKKKCESYQDQIVILTENLVKIKEQCTQYDIFIKSQSSLTKTLYTGYELDDLSVFELNKVEKNQMNDRKFIRASLKALYFQKESELRSKSMKATENTTPVTPEKLKKLKSIFLTRLIDATADINERNTRYSHFPTYLSKVLYEFRSNSEENES